MHILYLHQYFVPPDGVGGTRSYEFAKRFVKAGHKVTIITSNAYIPEYYFKENKKEIIIDGIKIKALNIPYSNKFSFVRRILAFVKYILQASVEVVKIRNVDVVFATSTPLTIAIPGIIAKKRHKCPMIFEVRDLWPEIPIAMGILKNFLLKWVAKKLEQLSYRYSDHIVALSPGMKDEIICHGVPDNSITVIPNCSNVKLFRVSDEIRDNFYNKHPYLKTGPLVLYAGTFGLVNGADYLVDLAKEMKSIDTSIKFLLAGRGNQEDLIRLKAYEMNVLENNFWIIPPIPKENMPQVLSACTVTCSFVIDIPALWNNSANKVFDAFAAGKPLVINHGGWQAELIKKTGAGLVIPSRDSKCAARMLCEFIRDERRYRAACQASRLLADEDFNIDKLFDKLMIVFQHVIANKK